MGVGWCVCGLLLLVTVLSDVVETVVLPRTVHRGVRLTPLFMRLAWNLVRPLAEKAKPGVWKQSLLVAFAPMFNIGMIGLWGALLITSFALLHMGVGTQWHGHGLVSFADELYVSGVNFFTLGLGDFVADGPVGRVLCVLEAGMGFGFLGLVVGYVPVYYSAFSRREVAMVLLDTKAGSEPSAGELLERYAQAKCFDDLASLLKDYERWSGELLEAYLSYPILAFYRSQHEDQHWLKTMTAILDACALIESSCKDQPALRFQARNTFAMARHVLVDVAYVVGMSPCRKTPSRLTTEQLEAILSGLNTAGFPLQFDESRLAGLRASYEPYVSGLAKGLLVDLPLWHPGKYPVDHWQTSAWDGMRHF